MRAIVVCEVSCAIPSLGVIGRAGEERVVSLDLANDLVRTGKWTFKSVAPDIEEVKEIPDRSQESIETIDGIGPSKAKRLASAGIETLEEIAFCDPEEVAKETELKLSDIEKWQRSAALTLENIQEE